MDLRVTFLGSNFFLIFDSNFFCIFLFFVYLTVTFFIPIMIMDGFYKTNMVIRRIKKINGGAYT